MKSLLKFSLLTALIISGKLAKQPAPVTTAQAATVNAAPDNSSVVLVNQRTASKPVKPIRQQTPVPQSGTGLLAGMF